jgi:hypothetical protein
MAGEPMVLCRPSAGLYDILCQIGTACQYAERTGRIAIIDTNHPSTRFFRDDVSRYFVSRQPNLVLTPARHAHLFDACEVHPPFVQGRVNSYVARFAEVDYVEAETGQSLSLDFDRLYDQPLVLHHAGGRSPHALAALARMRLHDQVADVLLDRLRAIGQPFHAIHIRDTDYKADFQPHLEPLLRRLKGPVFVASDNRAAVDQVRATYAGGAVFSFAALPETAGQPPHRDQDRAAPERIFASNRDSIVDLMMLSLGLNLFYFSLLPNGFGAQVSGFSLLADELRKAPYVLSPLIARRDLDLERWLPVLRGY